MCRVLSLLTGAPARRRRQPPQPSEGAPPLAIRAKAELQSALGGLRDFSPAQAAQCADCDVIIKPERTCAVLLP